MKINLRDSRQSVNFAFSHNFIQWEVKESKKAINSTSRGYFHQTHIYETFDNQTIK
jgi:hypothetical protein